MAQARLQKETKDILKEGMGQSLSALPLESDIFCWHCNIVAPDGTAYAGGIFHIELNFTKKYPSEPPSARILNSNMPHPRVYDGRICVDILRDFQQYFRGEVASGWQSCYGVDTILVQLQEFLTHIPDSVSDSALPDYLDRIPIALKKSREFKCSKCEHRPGQLWPPIGGNLSQSQEIDQIQESLVCFHSRQSYKDSILGFLVNIETKTDGRIHHITSPFDFLSYSAFKSIAEKPRGKHGQHFLPLFIQEEHGKRAIELAKVTIPQMCSASKFDPSLVLEVLPSLMNQTVVSIAQGKEHYSVRYLQGYCYIHRLLLKFFELHPELLQSSEQKLLNFSKSPKNRTKSVTPDLGKLLTLLTVTDVSWNVIAPAYLSESFDRNVFWLLRKFPWLDNDRPDVNRVRNQITFHAAMVSCQILMFDIYFLQNVARPIGVSLKEIAERYDSRLGQPEADVCIKLQQECTEIKNVSNFNEVFERVGLPALPEEVLQTRLKTAIRNSSDKNYHRSRADMRIKLPNAKFFEDALNHPTILGTLLEPYNFETSGRPPNAPRKEPRKEEKREKKIPKHEPLKHSLDSHPSPRNSRSSYPHNRTYYREPHSRLHHRSTFELKPPRPLEPMKRNPPQKNQELSASQPLPSINPPKSNQSTTTSKSNHQTTTPKFNQQTITPKSNGPPLASPYSLPPEYNPFEVLKEE